MVNTPDIKKLSRQRSRGGRLERFLLLLLLPLVLSSGGFTCERTGDTSLSSLEFQIAGQDQLVFDTGVRTYDVQVTEGISTALVKAQSTDPAAQVTWNMDGTGGFIGIGGGEVTLDLPPDQATLFVFVKAPGGAAASYVLHITASGPCVDGASCVVGGLPGICVGSTCTPLPDEPSSPRIALLAATDVDALSVAWHPATDNLTPTEQMVYEVHVSDQPGFTPDLTTLATAVTGETQAELAGLSAGVEYEVAVVAIDADGFSTEDRRRARTLSLPVQFSSSVPFGNAENMDLGEPVVAGTTYTFAPGPSAQMPTVGGILVGPIGPDFYLRTVDSVTVQGSQLVVETSDGALDDAVDQFAIRNSVTLSELAAQGAGAPAGAFLQKGQAAASSRTWANRLLRAEEQDGDGFLTSSNSGAQFMTKDLSASAEVDVDVTVTFQPTLETDLDWSGTTVNSGRIIATGDLTFDTKAAFDFSVSSTPVSEEQTLFTRTYIALYSVGTVPVLQTITLSVDAKLEVTAEVTAKANVDATNTAAVSAGIVYNPATGSWEPTSNFGFSNTVNVDLSAQAGVTATLELAPKVEVAFYAVAYADLSLTGNLRGMIPATDNQDADSPCFGAELDKADITFTASCGANLGLNLILKKFPLAIDLPFCGPFDYPLFNLPAFTPQQGSGAGTTGDPIVVEAGVTTGVNNDLDPSSVQWSAIPIDAQLTQSASGPPEGYLECGDSDTYKVYFSGHGALGELGRRCASVDVDCCGRDISNPADPRDDPANVIGKSIWGEYDGGGGPWCEYVNPDGTIQGWDLDGEYAATWSISGSAVCYTYGPGDTFCQSYAIACDRIQPFDEPYDPTYMWVEGRIDDGNTCGAEICDSGNDEDNDGDTDCSDTDCNGSPLCEICDNGIEDDGDFDIDCEDQNCIDWPGCQEDCTNGIDDNGTGTIDCDDWRCIDAPGCFEICDNGIDDDGDGDVDCLDLDCPRCPEICDNGIDDDGDRYVDCWDLDCRGLSSSCGEVCSNGVDDDQNGYTDCEDLACAHVPVCGCSSALAAATDISAPGYRHIAGLQWVDYTGSGGDSECTGIGPQMWTHTEYQDVASGAAFSNTKIYCHDLSDSIPGDRLESRSRVGFYDCPAFVAWRARHRLQMDRPCGGTWTRAEAYVDDGAARGLFVTLDVSYDYQIDIQDLGIGWGNNDFATFRIQSVDEFDAVVSDIGCISIGPAASPDCLLLPPQGTLAPGRYKITAHSRRTPADYSQPEGICEVPETTAIVDHSIVFRPTPMP